MADDAHSQFVDGLRVTADHLQHLQDRLRESVQDLRRTVGLGRIGWGLRATLAGTKVQIDPGVAFAPSGVRLAVDAALSLDLAGVTLPVRVVARAANTDTAALRVGGTPTLVKLLTSVSLEPDAGPALGDDALLLARVTQTGADLPALSQADTLFVASGNHAHSGQHVQDEQGRWHYDGPLLASAQGATGPAGPQGDPGPSGPTGLIGPVGAQGEPGAPGPQGDPGPAGPQGTTGPVGPAGLTGPAGALGDLGAAGPQGVPGPAGATGDAGPAGPVGLVGPAGQTGQTGQTGEVGQAGPQGVVGQAGASGATGATGDAGPAGPVGPVGPVGPNGDAGAAGLAGAPGSVGPTGADGTPGPVGPVGAVGPTGAPGPQGTPGLQGLIGPPGPTGPTGQSGPAGSVGLAGTAGAVGPAGSTGPVGTDGAIGSVGPAGPAGLTGPAGPIGPVAALDWPFVVKVNWPHGQTIGLTQAVGLLANLRFDLSLGLATDVLGTQPAVVQVWFEPNSASATAAVSAAIATVHGAAKLSPTSIIWQTSDPAGTIMKLMISGGRLLVRLHTGVLLDKDRRAFSAALDALIGAAQPHVPGGVFEGWVMVQAG